MTDNVLQKGRVSKKHSKSRNHHASDVTKLLVYAVLGKSKKLKRILKHHPSSVRLTDVAGQTALHKAAEQGHEDIAQLLLRYGADSTTRDNLGNTPAHLAAIAGHQATFTALMLAEGAPDLDTPNESGLTIRVAMQRMIHAQTRCTTNPNLHHSEDAWAEKLAMNEEYDQDYTDHFSGFRDMEQGQYEDFSTASGHQAYGLNEDEYAQKIWEEMQRRRHQAQGPSAATADSWARADELDSHAKRKKQAAEDAKERSQKILEEETAKDAAWRQAVKEGNAGVKRASYEAKWHIFSTASSKISKKDVPLLTSTPDEARAIMLHGTSGRSEIKQRVKLELMKWHPDKFQGRFGNRLSTEHRDEILEYVKRMSQMLNDLLRTA